MTSGPARRGPLEPSDLRVDIGVNFAARAWSALAGLIAVPPYLAMLGLEQYGLVGVYATLQGLLLIFDLGFGPALARELARAPRPVDEAARDITWTFSVTTVMVAIAIAAVLAPLAPFVAGGWLRAETLDPQRLRAALELLAIALATNLPPTLYHQGLVGMGMQVTANIVQIVFVTLRALGVIAAMHVFGATPEVFFAWQIACGVGQAVVGAYLLRRALGPGPRHFRFALLRAHQRFALGMTGTALFMTLYGAADRLILSKLLLLDAFGLYNLAVTAAFALSMLTSPITSVFLPRFARIGHAPQPLEAEYFHGSRLASVLLTPFALVLALFGSEAMHAWTGRPWTGEMRWVVFLLAMAAYFSGMLHLSTVMQSGLGRTRFVFQQYAVGLFVGVPIIAIAAHARGALGAAASLFVIQLGYLVIAGLRVHTALLPAGAAMRWWRRVVIPPLVTTLVITVVIRLLWSGGGTRWIDGLGVAVISIVVFGAVILVDRYGNGALLRTTR